MTKEKHTSLVEKYLNANTSLSEEEILFTNSQDSDEGIEDWSKYVKHNRKSVPIDLNNNLWSKSSLSKTIRAKVLIPVLTAAASVFLFFMVGQLNKPTDSPTYMEKKMLLEEALSMFEEVEEKPSYTEVLYKDELVTIYLSSN